MNDDEFDEMLKARHKAFIADLAEVLPPARLPVAAPPPPPSRMTLFAQSIAARTGFVQQLFYDSPAVRAAIGLAFSLAMVATVLVVVEPYGPAADRHTAISQQTARPQPTPPAPVPTTRFAESAVPQAADVPRSWPNLAPAPMAAPSPRSPAPAPRRQVQDLSLLFAPDSVDLAEADALLLRALAEDWVPGERVSVVGHTARFGPADSAVALSRRRAEVVRDELIVAGIPASEITSAGVGFDDAAGVVDPRDRRVVVKRLPAIS
jgi:outer membrane protein OmpA-like peptidoglycan-associated protein